MAFALSFSQQNIHQISNIYLTSQHTKSGSHFGTTRAGKEDLSVARKPLSFRCNASLQHKEKRRETSKVDMKKILESLHQLIPHIFTEPELVLPIYDDSMTFSDPVIRLASLKEFSRYIETMKNLCRTDVQLHYAKQTGPYEITTRWTVVMKFIHVPWKPDLVLTGTSIMEINPQTQKFCNHVDVWDSIEKKDYFSVQGLRDILQQMRFYKTPDLESPKYQILKRTADYEVRRYNAFVVVENEGDNFLGSKDFNDVLGYIMGKNSSMEKIPMTTPVLTQIFDAQLSKVSIQIILPLEKDLKSLPHPSEETLRLRRVEGGIAAVSKFSGKLTKDIFCAKERTLRSALIKDGRNPKQDCLLATYNDPNHTWSFIMRNEVLIWLEDFVLE